jgi:outer membrane murein-binding lipoprotein Lpp
MPFRLCRVYQLAFGNRVIFGSIYLWSLGSSCIQRERYGNTIMATLLKLFLMAHVSAVLMLAGSSGMADDTATAESNITAKVEALEKTLGLSEDQVAKAQPIFTDNIQQRKSVMSSYGLGNNDGAFNKLSFNKKRQLSKKMSAINSATDKELKTILSSEQMKQYQSIREANKEKTLDKMKAGS